LFARDVVLAILPAGAGCGHHGFFPQALFTIVVIIERRAKEIRAGTKLGLNLLRKPLYGACSLRAQRAALLQVLFPCCGMEVAELGSFNGA
jgi:hypothetical protein